ncbi:nucleotidyltransferase family protein [Microbacterium marinum]|uniref:nucleotidyltransferase family protein n=1 Tax=Microbacterium marinum TaxID=421115 RepID=UPI00384E1ED3
MEEATIDVPLAARLVLGRAAVQVLADRAGVDLLHLKGNVVDPSLRDAGLIGTDIDVLVRPDGVGALHTILLAHGWSLYSSFANGSPFEHAQTYWHDMWGYLDLHRLFPGIRAAPAAAFDRLWHDSAALDVAGVACRVPSVDAQLVVLILNAARGGGVAATPLERIWDEAAPARRAAVRDLVDALDAPVAFAAAFGRLDDVSAERDHALWSVIVRGGTRSQEWWGRVRAARGPLAAMRVAMRAPLVNIDRLRHQLGREPTAADVLRSFAARARMAVAEAARRWLR